ncbi:MAG: CpsD/CapB family tyrosine-protein kinase [Acidimicrobiales bacterium]
MDNEEELELGYYAAALRRRWWIVVATALAFAAMAFLLVPAQLTRYRSEATMLITPVALDGVEGSRGSDKVNEETEAGILASTPVANRAINRLQSDGIGAGWTAEDFQEWLTVVAGDDTQLLTLWFEADSPDVAQAAVSAAAEEYQQFKLLSTTERRARVVLSIEAQLEAAESQRDLAITTLEDAEEGSAKSIIAATNVAQFEHEVFDLRTRIDRLQTLDLTAGQVIGEPTIAEPIVSGIDRPLGLAVAFAIGAMAGMAAALLLDRVDRRVRDIGEIEADLGGPVVGDIPRITEDTPTVVTAQRAETDGANAFRRLATAVIARDRNVGSILITSANNNEGRTLTAINTAIALSQAGVPVVLMNADRRNPSIDRIFGLESHPGLEGFLRTAGSQADAMTLLQSTVDVLGLRVLPSGVGAGVGQPMSSRAIETVLEVASTRGAIVVIDAPPALSNPDGLALASLVDATYVVVAPGRTGRDELADLRVQLQRVGSEVAGVIVNRLNRWDLRNDEQPIAGLTVKKSQGRSVPNVSRPSPSSSLPEPRSAAVPPATPSAAWPEHDDANGLAARVVADRGAWTVDTGAASSSDPT